MASSRPARRNAPPSFRLSPAEAHQQPRSNGIQSAQSDLNNDDWQEPAPRPAAPSFEDYKGLERHGVLEHMAPLGSFPNAKVKGRIRQHDPPRRSMHLRNGDSRLPREAPLPQPVPAQRPVVYQQPPAPPPQQKTPSEFVMFKRYPDELNIDPGLLAVSQPAQPPLKATETTTPDITPTARTSLFSTQAKVQKRVVTYAMQRASEKGQTHTALALQMLYHEAEKDQRHLDMWIAATSEHGHPEHREAFRKFMRSTKGRLKRGGKRSLQPSAPSLSVSHPDDEGRVAPQSPAVPSETNVPKKINFLTPKPLADTPSKKPSSRSRYNRSPSKNGPSPKRRKRSRSMSTESTLSSINSDIENFAPADASQVGPSGHGQEGTDQSTPEERIAARRRLRRDFREVKTGESSIRASLDRPRRSTPSSTGPHSRAQQQPQSQRASGHGLRSQVNDGDSTDSPLSSEDESLPPPPSGARGITPQLGRPPKGGAKKAARIKQSPLKKRNGVTAGFAQPTDVEIQAPPTLRHDDIYAETDVCSACSGNGSLILCDNCPRGYHFTCCDPPLPPDTRSEELPEQWFCRRCASQRSDERSSNRSRGLWTELNKTLQSRNPTAFRLPRGVREYFEGVSTGDEGEYEEIHNVKISKARSGYEETPDNLRLKDRKDNTILCFRCGNTSNGKREIVPCDYCHSCWHLDCLDPPLASAPNKKSTNGKPRQAWMCPNHIDHDLINMTASVPAKGKKFSKTPSAPQPEEIRRVFRSRKAKQPTIVDIGLRRGFKNNGVIDIDEDPSEDESEMEKELTEVVYRVPERGIKLDFIDRIRQSTLERQQYEMIFAKREHRDQKAQRFRTSKQTRPRSTSNLQQEEIDRRPFRERKAALNLTQLAQQGVDLNPDKVLNLIQTLEAEAPQDVESLLISAESHLDTSSAGENPVPATISAEERKDLEALIALAQRRLQCSVVAA